MKENTHLRSEFKDLKDEFSLLRNPVKRGVEDATESSPPEAPVRAKPKADVQTGTMYTPKDMEGLYKAYKDALAGKEMALREAECLKERMAKVSASKIRLAQRRSVAARKTTPRNLKTTLEAVDVDSDEGEGNLQRNKRRGTVDSAHELEQAKLQEFREKRLKELRTGKKQELEELCKEEGVTYIRLDQAKTDIAEIRARRDFDEWFKTKSLPVDDDDQRYSTSVEDTNEA
ncbi:hypothetical protein CBR_g56523 [Chara braunii]|uniref:Uncharacterized protein n=1 Tax=Chara braunii TaxID=69332 RepID=A0A388MDH6_CHABU|nr:hypothetical protein CBR_g56523 [Chara braunii]|eukprot:GBG92618.1 hypothetical protein CBR_g56523 [Chara braunii]